jgi:hypothetical protein
MNHVDDDVAHDHETKDQVVVTLEFADLLIKHDLDIFSAQHLRHHLHLRVNFKLDHLHLENDEEENAHEDNVADGYHYASDQAWDEDEGVQDIKCHNVANQEDLELLAEHEAVGYNQFGHLEGQPKRVEDSDNEANLVSHVRRVFQVFLLECH